MPVEWSRLGGEQIEKVLGVLLLRQYPNAERVRPGQGDHGIDIYIPGNDGWTVYQIKGFVGALTSSKKGQITKSWARFTSYIGSEGRKVAAWHLVRPENATMPDRKFLAGLTSGSHFPCSPKGLDFCESLAAKYPDVIDYYLHDGRDRVEELARKYLVAMRVVPGDDPAFTPETSVEQLDAIHTTINRTDPHYRYDLAVQSRPPGIPPDSIEWPRPDVDEPSLMFVRAYVSEERAIIFKVLTRYRGAEEDRPLTGRLTITLKQGNP
jgi:hypothetical protein